MLGKSARRLGYSGLIGLALGLGGCSGPEYTEQRQGQQIAQATKTYSPAEQQSKAPENIRRPSFERNYIEIQDRPDSEERLGRIVGEDREKSRRRINWEQYLEETINRTEKVWWLPRLGINNEDYKVGAILTEEEGIRQIGMLARNADQEDAWVYVSFRDGEKGAWIDIGKPSNPEKADEDSKSYGLDISKEGKTLMAVTSDSPYLYRLFEANKKVINKAVKWHIHPKVCCDIVVSNGMEEAKKSRRELSEGEVNFMRFHYSVISSLHSRIEIPVLLNLTTSMSSMGINYSDAVRSAYGSVILSVTEKAKEKFTEMSIPDMADYTYKLWEASGANNVQLPRELWPEKPDSPKVNELRLKTLKEICDGMSTDYIKFEFIASD